MRKISTFKKWACLWVTGFLFLFSLTGHWLFGWSAYKQEQAELGLPIVAGDYMVQAMRDTLENWQSEFLQLMWQVGGLAFLWYVGSPKSKEGDERKEAKIDEILRSVNPVEAEKIMHRLDEKYPRK